MRVQPVAINWHPALPIFAKESFLKAVSDEYGWLGGFSDSGKLRCLLPYTIIRKAIFRMVRFRTETISMVRDFDVSEEKDFLSGAVGHFRSIGADMIIPATTNTIFRAFPDGAEAAPYGSYVIDLSQAEDVLWKNIDRITRQNINAAAKNGVVIKDYTGPLEEVHVLIRETFRRSKLPFMDFASFRRFMSGLGENGKLMIADHQGTAQSFVVFAFSDYCAYAIYAGNAADQQPGANKLLYWEAIRSFRGLGVHLYDFVGARIDPEKGSKQESLASLKRHFGATLKRGYMWKYPFHPLKYRLYGLATRLRSGGDIVDAERHKLDGSGAGNP